MGPLSVLDSRAWGFEELGYFQVSMEPDFDMPRILNLGRIPGILFVFQTQLVDTSR